MVLITTSRHPTMGARILSKDLSLLLPNATRINRGKANIKTLIAKTLELQQNLILLIEAGKPKPKKIKLVNITPLGEIKKVITFNITNFIRKKEITKKRVPTIKSYYFKVDEEIPLTMEKHIRSFTSLFNLKKLENNSINGKAILIYFTMEKSFLLMSFYLIPDMVEIGPRIYINRIYSGGHL
ncbi:MAG: hypothetical protein ACTSQY_01415 [Candidatus Odinarchaeia archaeon]